MVKMKDLEVLFREFVGTCSHFPNQLHRLRVYIYQPTNKPVMEAVTYCIAFLTTTQFCCLP